VAGACDFDSVAMSSLGIPEPVPEILLTTKLLQRKVLLVILVTEKLSCRSEIPREDVFRATPVTVRRAAISMSDTGL
jgi:hypothetical protein